jgi:hypothetical protein
LVTTIDDVWMSPWVTIPLVHSTTTVLDGFGSAEVVGTSVGASVDTSVGAIERSVDVSGGAAVDTSVDTPVAVVPASLDVSVGAAVDASTGAVLDAPADAAVDAVAAWVDAGSSQIATPSAAALTATEPTKSRQR